MTSLAKPICLTGFEEEVLRRSAQGANGSMSAVTIASYHPKWRRAVSRGVLTANVRRAGRRLESLGLAILSPGRDRWESGSVTVTDKGREYLRGRDEHRSGDDHRPGTA